MREHRIYVDLGSEAYHQLLEMGYAEGTRLFVDGQTFVRFTIPHDEFISMERRPVSAEQAVVST